MTITDNIIRDLLPLYVTGEASDDTRALVDEYLARNPSLRAEAVPLDGNPLPAIAPPADLETRALAETRRWIGRRQAMLGWALGLSYAIFSFRFSKGEMTHLLYRDFPAAAVALLAASAVCWIAFLHACRRLSGTAMTKPSRGLWVLFGAIATVPFSLFVTVHTGWDLVRDMIPIGGVLGLWLSHRLTKANQP